MNQFISADTPLPAPAAFIINHRSHAIRQQPFESRLNILGAIQTLLRERIDQGFYDPCACVPKGWKPTYPEGMTKDDLGAWSIFDEQRAAKCTEIAHQKLIAQIEHFFEYLAKNPVR